MFVKSAFIIASIFTLCSCAAENHAIKERFLWPPPPETPRIEWLGAYSSQLNLPKTSFRVFRETIVGEDKATSLKRPVEARIDSLANKVYVADMDIPAVYIFDFKENELRNLIIDKDINKYGFIKPISLSLDNLFNLYILDAYSKSIFIYNQKEKLIKAIPIADLVEMPVSILYDNFRKQIFVSDAKTNRIIAVDENGVKKLTIGRGGDDRGEFNRPVGMALNSKGELIVVDSFNARIQIFDGNGRFLRMFGKRGDGNAEFQLIKGVAVDPDDNIYVTDSRSNNIKIFNQNGLPLLVFGGYYAVATTGKTAAGGFALPIGIDIDKNGTIAIVDQLNARIQLFKYLDTPSQIAK